MTTVIESLSAARIVPVLVIDDAHRAAELGAALAEGGIRAAEVTLRTPAGLEALAAMSQVDGLTVGAGTVLSARQVDECADAGATFIVSPGWDDEVVARAQQIGLGILPGVATATEVQRAVRAGLTHLKLFPAGQLGGLAMIDSLCGPFPGLQYMPSGGVGPSNAAEYIAHRAVFALSGSWMASRATIEAGDFDGIRAASREAMDLVR
ncbi:MAG: bifunctional 4-hydroxy-2-oxoglutarate aldolase/2-dehydro-3-deoxy-phosphogluconate aldolase [Pseudolysinimonas sp.]